MVNFEGWWKRTGLTDMRNSPIVQKTIKPMRAYAREAHAKNEARLAAARQNVAEIERREQFEEQRAAAISAEEKRIEKALKDAGDAAEKLVGSPTRAVTKLRKLLEIIPQLRISTIRRGATAETPSGGKADIVQLQRDIRLQISAILGDIKVAYDAEADEEKITTFLGDVEARLVQSVGIMGSAEAKVITEDARFEKEVNAIVKKLNSAVKKLRGKATLAEIAKLTAHVVAIEAQLRKLRAEVRTIFIKIKTYKTNIARDEIRMRDLNTGAAEILPKVKKGNYDMYSEVRTASSLVEYNRLDDCIRSINTAIRLATEVGALGKRLQDIVARAQGLCNTVTSYATKLVPLEKNLQTKMAAEYTVLAGLIATADSEMNDILRAYP